MPDISRRDFLNGLAFTGAAATLPASVVLAASPEAYPPALTGLRGSHPGAYEQAHQLAWGGQRPAGKPVAPAEQYDLVVIGAGISGLAAAYFYRQQYPAAKVLLLDNHDDFGGHARRNEFSVGGKTLISYGGTQSFDHPGSYSKVASKLLRELGIDLPALAQAYDLEYFQRHGMSSGVFYDAAHFGRNVLLRSAQPTTDAPSAQAAAWLPGMLDAPRFADTLARAPLNAGQRRQLQAVLAGGAQPALAAWLRDGKRAPRFEQLRYTDLLREVYGIRDTALLLLLSMPLAEDAALGGNAITLPLALEGGLLGLPSAARLADWLDDDSLLPAEDEAEDDAEGDALYVHHFPYGNATLARLLVQHLIPTVAKVTNPVQSLAAAFDYRKLDQADSPVRLRLRSLAVEAVNQGQGVRVRYLRDGKLYEATARHSVMAGWHMLAAHILPELPASQKAAMRANLKLPLVYVQVALRRWPALQRAGVAAAYCPGSFFQFVQLDFPVRMAAVAAPANTDQPVVLLMIRMPCPPLGEGEVPDLLRQGRAELLGADFASYENQVRQQLQAMYGAHGFDAKRDIAAITVNRWAHGYTWEDAQYQGEPAHTLAARPLGRIVMAGTDSTGRAYTDAAIDAAWQALRQLPRP